VLLRELYILRLKSERADHGCNSWPIVGFGGLAGNDPKPPAQDAKADLRRSPPERLTRQARRTRIRRFEASGLG